jgi:hypothetical protein
MAKTLRREETLRITGNKDTVSYIAMYLAHKHGEDYEVSWEHTRNYKDRSVMEITMRRKGYGRIPAQLMLRIHGFIDGFLMADKMHRFGAFETTESGLRIKSSFEIH